MWLVVHMCLLYLKLYSISLSQGSKLNKYEAPNIIAIICICLFELLLIKIYLNQTVFKVITMYLYGKITSLCHTFL